MFHNSTSTIPFAYPKNGYHNLYGSQISDSFSEAVRPYTRVLSQRSCTTPVSLPETVSLENASPSSLYRDRKSKPKPAPCVLCLLESTYRVPSEHRNSATTHIKPSKTYFANCLESSEIVNRRFSRIFSSIFWTSSSLTTEGLPLLSSSMVFVLKILYNKTHWLLCTPLLVTFWP